MRVMTSDIFDRWTRGAGLVALIALVWAVVVPQGTFWTALLAAGLMGAAIATAMVVRTRQEPTLAEVIATAEAEPVFGPALPSGYASRAALRPMGDRNS